MATPLKNVKCGDRTYYISHSGDTVYYSAEGPGKGTNSISGLRFSNNQIINTSTGKPVQSDYELCQKMGK